MGRPPMLNEGPAPTGGTADEHNFACCSAPDSAACKTGEPYVTLPGGEIYINGEKCDAAVPSVSEAPTAAVSGVLSTAPAASGPPSVREGTAVPAASVLASGSPLRARPANGVAVAAAAALTATLFVRAA